MRIARVLWAMVLTAAPAMAVDDVRLLRLSPPSGEILGTWDVGNDWEDQAGQYVEAEFEYTMDSVSLAQIHFGTGLRHTALHGWRTFGPGSGRFTARFTRMCEGKAPAPVSTTTFNYFLSESTADGATVRALDSGSLAAAYRFVCPERGLPDLAVELAAPATILPGELLADGSALIARNRGEAAAPGTIGSLDPANGYMIDLILSSDEVVPEGGATYSATYVEDVLLAGGRASRTYDLAPDSSRVYPEGASIPADTPHGLYFLCARIDPFLRVRESNEANNTACVRVRVGPEPALADVFIDFERRSEPAAVPYADATTIYQRLGVTFPSHPRIHAGGPALGSGFQALIQGDVRAARPTRTCGPLQIALAPELRARQVRFEAHNVGFIDFPLLITATARDAAGTVVATVNRRSESRLGRLRPVEIIDLLPPATAGDIHSVTVEYSSCPPHVVIDNLFVRAGH